MTPAELHAAERSAWAPPARIGPVEWAETYRVIPQRGNPEPGRYSLDRTPYWREPLEAMGLDSPITHISIMKTPQVGASEWVRTALGYRIDVGGDDALVVFPTQDACEEQISERIAPMLEETPRLARWLTGRVYDLSAGELYLSHCTVYAGWASSPQALASRPLPIVLLDETDKFQGKPGEAPPDELADHRTTAFPRRKKVAAISTPTVKTGTVYRLWKATRNRRHYHARCPHCGQLDLWSWERFGWDRRGDEQEDEELLLEIADQIESGELRAWVVCAQCGCEVHEQDRLTAVARGEWVTEGRAPGDQPRSRRVAYHVPSWLSPWVRFADVVATFLRCTFNGDLHDFWNGRCGLPAEEVAGSVPVSVFESRAQARPFVVPAWATAVVAGADTQVKGGQPYWVYVVRAWGRRNKSRLVAWGKAYTPAELLASTVGASFELEGTGRQAGAQILLVDSGGGADVETLDGNTTQLVHEIARRHPARVIPVRGASQPQDRLVRTTSVDYLPPGSKARAQVILHVIDTERAKDVLSSLIRAVEPEVLWEESALVTPEYVGQMTAEEKTRVRLGRKIKLRWMKTAKGRNDLWDASVYCLVGAIMMRADARAERREKRREAPPKKIAQAREERRESRYGGRLRVDRGRGWVARRT